MLGLQRTAGNAAVTSLVAGRRRLLRNPPRPARSRGAPIEEPGKGYDGIQSGTDLLPRTFNDAQIQALRDFRGQLEKSAAASDQSKWARWAGEDTAKFDGTMYQRAQLYAEFQRQMIQVDRNWYAAVEKGTDGSFIFLSKPQLKRTFVVHPDGWCYAGDWEGIPGQAGARTPDYGKLTKLAGPSATGGGGPAGPVGSGGGSGPQGDPSYSKGQKATAVVALVALGANIILNGWIARRNEERIKEQLKALEPELQRQQQESPGLGFLLTFGFKGGADSGEGPTATGRFTGISWIRGVTEADARSRWSSMDPDVQYQMFWINPTDLSALSPPGWSAVAVAKFADPSELVFQRVEFAQVGGLGRKRTRTVDSSDWAKYAGSLRFVVLEMPSELPYKGAGGGDKKESVEVKTYPVKGGPCPAATIDDKPVVAAVAADEPTYRFFHVRGTEGELSIDDKMGALKVSYIEQVRWFPLDQVEIVTSLTQQNRPAKSASLPAPVKQIA